MPFIWADPEEIDRGARTDRMGQTHDIGATVLERARIEAAIGVKGQPLLGSGRAAALIHYDHQKENPNIGAGPRVHALRTDRWRLTPIAGVEWGEHNDLKRDPGEFENLSDSPDHEGTRGELLEQLARAEIDATDRAPFPTGHG